MSAPVLLSRCLGRLESTSTLSSCSNAVCSNSFCWMLDAVPCLPSQFTAESIVVVAPLVYRSLRSCIASRLVVHRGHRWDTRTGPRGLWVVWAALRPSCFVYNCCCTTRGKRRQQTKKSSDKESGATPASGSSSTKRSTSSRPLPLGGGAGARFQVRVEVVAQPPLWHVAALRPVAHVAAVLRRGGPVQVRAEGVEVVRPPPRRGRALGVRLSV